MKTAMETSRGNGDPQTWTWMCEVEGRWSRLNALYYWNNEQQSPSNDGETDRERTTDDRYLMAQLVKNNKNEQMNEEGRETRA
ncbi:hypothetical protein PRIPAC_81791 [Pristionchus pacificus]|uniref:Uncharacterized protein n=1 Tax=Pristionchus pacificus TaxID=54126 RepID=A0A2A6C225_PRIPA|nr:hypothetical protein PRIPAC_81791 [Pristionchus pacificus]|eukprot:PDM72186.1 hypothetical protein PRIPAC_38620 [Pristionchus pacificus]